MSQPTQNWDTVIEPKHSIFTLNLKEVWKYRDLLVMFVKRDFITVYKQTILGPIWFFIQPIFTTLIYIFVFGRVAGLSTDGLPQSLFYLSGVTAWTYFSTCFTKVATTFNDNQNVFGKVYFPRLVTPLSIVLSNLLRFGVQMLLFLCFLFYYLLFTDANVNPNWALSLLPILILTMAGLGLGMGMIITSYTTKYRDLVFLLQFGVQLLMYATPIIYPLSMMPEKYAWIIQLNPMTGIVETFRYAFLGAGSFSWGLLGYSIGFTIVITLIGTMIFNKTEKNFMDTV